MSGVRGGRAAAPWRQAAPTRRSAVGSSTGVASRGDVPTPLSIEAETATTVQGASRRFGSPVPVHSLSGFWFTHVISQHLLGCISCSPEWNGGSDG
jgi:hypothetical protein